MQKLKQLLDDGEVKMITYEEIKNMEKQAEEERVKGNRAKFLRINCEVDIAKEKLVLQNHKERLERVKKEFPIGTYIPEIRATIKDIKDGCGTQRGWIEIYLSGQEKGIGINEFREKIRKNNENKESRDYFNKLKYSDKGKIKIGENNLDVVDYLLSYMEMNKIDTLQEYDENSIDWYSETYKYYYEEAIKDGYTDEEAEEKGREAEDEESSREFNQYLNKVLEAINYLLSFAELSLEKDKKNYYIKPFNTWKSTANKVAEIIHGHGTFDYKSGKVLKEIGPYKNYCEAVMKHLHWLKHAPEIYGNKNYNYMMGR